MDGVIGNGEFEGIGVDGVLGGGVFGVGGIEADEGGRPSGGKGELGVGRSRNGGSIIGTVWCLFFLDEGRLDNVGFERISCPISLVDLKCSSTCCLYWRNSAVLCIM